MRITVLLLTLCLSLSLVSQGYTTYLTGESDDVITSPTPGICMMGGAGDHDNAIRWLLERADGGDVVVIRASGSDGYNDYFYSDLGVTVNSVETIVFDDASASDSPYVLERLASAEAIWIAGGDQWDYVSYWKDTEVEDILNDHVQSKPIGGTSAGMAILGGSYFSAQFGTVTSSVALQYPTGIQTNIGSEDFLEIPYCTRLITDTHYDDPDRKGRHAVFLAKISINSQANSFGIACDEYTAVCIDENGLARVFGEHPEYDDNAYFLQSNCESPFLPEVLEQGQALTWNRNQEAIKVYHVQGDWEGTKTFDLNDWRTGSGGQWENWWVEAGQFFEAEGTEPACPLSLVEPNVPVRQASFFVQEGMIAIPDAPRTESMQLMDMSGRIVDSWNRNHERIIVRDLPAGIYQLVISYEDHILTGRFTI